MSTQLKDKQQSKSKDQVPSRDLQADFHFNQHIFRTVAYTAAGFGLGMVSSLLFKHKAGMTIFFAGAGAGYGGANFVNELHTFRNKRNPTEINKRSGNQSQIKDKLERTADSFKGDLQQAKNKVERGVEDVGGKVANQVSQTARGAEEWARNASEKAQQHFQQKDHRRGGDDDKDDDKSNKKDQQRDQKRDQKREGDSQRRDQQKDQRKEADSHRKDQQKDHQKDQQKDQRKDAKNDDGKYANATLKGGLSETAKREEGSKEGRMVGNMRVDQFTSKIPVQNDNQGYDSPKQQWEGMNIKREDKSVGGQDKSAADKNKTINKDGQHFQDFKSNPNEAGKTTKISDVKQDYQRNRNRATEEDLDNKRRQMKGLQQDRVGDSVAPGITHKPDLASQTKQGFQNYKTGVSESLPKNQTNAHIDKESWSN